VTYADEILQIGNMILGKGVRYGNKKDFLFNLQESKPQTNTPEFKRFLVRARWWMSLVSRW
jgi:hypothetical protein